MNASPEAAGIARCPHCGLTEAELRAHGFMGCAVCYRIFEVIVAQVTAELHGVAANEAMPVPPPTCSALPWPTRRAEARPAPPAFPRERP